MRILNLHSGTDPEDPQLSVDLITVPLHAAPPFAALSYAWGDPLPQAEIRCCGLASKIGLSLCSALRQLRRHAVESDRLIWADALCINQGDTAERNAQVRMMGDIYARATSTLIWLGEEDDDVARGMTWLQRFVNARMVLYAEDTETVIPTIFGRVGVNTSAETEKALQSAFGERQDEAYREIWMLLRRPWFARKWVIQEVAKSTEHEMVLVSGSKRLAWKAVQAWLWFVETSPQTLLLFLGSYPWTAETSSASSSDVYSDFNKARMLALMRDKEAPLTLLLARTLGFRCTDPRDHIIALLGISTDGSFQDNLIDYDIPTEELYHRLAQACLKSPRDLRILWSFISTMPVDRRGAMSWMPNIGELPAMPGLAMQTLEVSQTMGIAPDPCRSKELGASTSGNQLQIKGRIVDRLEQLGMNMSTSSELGNFVQTMVTVDAKIAVGRWDCWLDECWGIAEMANHDEDSYLSALLAEDIMKTHIPETIAAVRKDFPAYRRAVKAIVSAADEAGFSEAMASYAATIESVGHLEAFTLKMLHRRFSRTLHGAVGWVPREAEEGDLICVFDGMELPYAVRPKDGTGDVYALVGECLISGVVAREAMDIDCVQSMIINLE
ncbi:hypothetical protein INS49_009450 [Diaporthe citri]|uniref:uncharacterized protein n=1 Tax=Diaporthe citri TaxID=83186 RepID=UPI001C80CDAD|nr:uncharacterized protein INS49_009450 [Diaporthe citri]KAG6361226.1 hypothetical protein INS49_009450 [Diaporthe citri]